MITSHSIPYLPLYYSISKFGSLNQHLSLTPHEGFDFTLIWLHGLGDSALGYLDIFLSDNTPTPKRMKVILLTAPIAPVSINSGMKMNSWFDIGNNFMHSERDVINNSKMIIDIIKGEVKMVNNDYTKILIGGFSQGAALSIYISLHLNHLLGGVILLSGFLFPDIDISKIVSEYENRNSLPIFAYHGEYDDMINEKMAKESYERLIENKFNFRYKIGKQAHEISLEELKEMKDFINQVIKNSKSKNLAKF